MRLPVLCLVVLSSCVSACGAGQDLLDTRDHMVHGWREKKTDDRTDAEKCEARAGWSWDAAASVCKKDTDFALNELKTKEACEGQSPGFVWLDGECRAMQGLDETQCARDEVAARNWLYAAGACRSKDEAECVKDPTKAWVKRTDDPTDSKYDCLGAPTIAVAKGELSQKISQDQPMGEVEFKLSEGAQLAIRKTNCAGYFEAAGATLKRNATSFVPGGTTVCTADVVAKLGKVESTQALTVKVEFIQGFKAVCEDAGASYEVRRTIYRIRVALKKTDASCADVATELTKATELDLGSADTDRLKDISALQGLPNLVSLSLRVNAVTDVEPLRNLPSLKVLDLSYNPIETIKPLAGMSALQLVILDGIPLGTKVQKTEDNCPTGDGVNAAIKAFCQAK